MCTRCRRAPRPTSIILTSLFVVCLAVSISAQAPADPSPQAAGSAAPSDKPRYQDLSINALISTSVVVNANTPASRTNQLRVFDADNRSFKLDVVELAVQRATPSPGQVGFTITPEVRIHPNFVVRGDLRRDHSNRAVFERSDGTFTGSQVTVSVNALFIF